MDHQDILEQVREIMLDVFDLDELDINQATTARDIKDWDSLSHIRLIVSIEKHYKMRFNSAEVEQFRDVGSMIAAIAQRSNA